MATKRVQHLAASSSLVELPAQFVRSADERPENTEAITEGIKVPIISLSKPRAVLVDEISKASSEWGFFLITDHGVPSSLIGRLQEVGMEFFRLPPEEKEKYANDPWSMQFEGYGTKLYKNPNNKGEWSDYYFHLVAPPSRINYQFWPTNPPSYRAVTEEYSKEISTVTDELLGLLSEGLGLKMKALKSCLGGEKAELEMKINMYPPCPNPELVFGVEPHTDLSALTLLVPNDVVGLQIWNHSNWVAVDHVPDALVVHVGDQLQLLSNGKYKSVLHRCLVSQDRTRMSWAVFIVPPADAVIGPLPQLLNDQSPAQYATQSFADFRHRKLNGLPQAAA